MKSLITKGTWYYEFQILMLVVMWQHDMTYKPQTCYGFRWGRLYIWFDTAWKSHGLVAKLRWFWEDLFHVPSDRIAGRTKFFYIRNNIRYMFANWVGGLKVYRGLKSFQAYLELTNAGFSISASKDITGNFVIYRFFWNGRLLRETCDIDRVYEHWNTVRDGHTETLS